MEYQVILDDFQGPLDLLLHLIKEKEMDLQTLELSVITDQYLQYIHMMESSQLEVMSEYLVMAAQLIEMKSKKLGKILEKADKNNIPYVIIIGENEITSGIIEIKDMANSLSTEINMDNIDDICNILKVRE